MLRTPLLALFLAAGCRDLQNFSTAGDHFEGTVVSSSFVRTGIAENVRLCLTLDADHLQDAPGTISTSDGRFQKTAMRSIPQFWHDPISTLSFGEGRVQNLVYAGTPGGSDAGNVQDVQDVLIVVSLLQSKSVEVRILRGAPGAAPAAAPALFGVFTLERQLGPCSF